MKESGATILLQVVAIGGPVMLHEGFRVAFEGENDVLRVFIGGFRFNRIKGG